MPIWLLFEPQQGPARSSKGWARPQKHLTCRRLRHRARSALLGRSKWPLEPTRLGWGARNGRSRQLGPAGALEMAARARSALPGHSKWPLEPARLRWTRIASLGRTTNACCAQLEDEHSRACHTQVLEPARLRLGARNGCSNPLGFAGALENSARTRSALPGRSKLLRLAARKHRTCQRFQGRAGWLLENTALADVSLLSKTQTWWIRDGWCTQLFLFTLMN